MKLDRSMAKLVKLSLSKVNMNVKVSQARFVLRFAVDYACQRP